MGDRSPDSVSLRDEVARILRDLRAIVGVVLGRHGLGEDVDVHRLGDSVVLEAGAYVVPVGVAVDAVLLAV